MQQNFDRYHSCINIFTDLLASISKQHQEFKSCNRQGQLNFHPPTIFPLAQKLHIDRWMCWNGAIVPMQNKGCCEPDERKQCEAQCTHTGRAHSAPKARQSIWPKWPVSSALACPRKVTRRRQPLDDDDAEPPNCCERKSAATRKCQK